MSKSLISLNTFNLRNSIAVDVTNLTLSQKITFIGMLLLNNYRFDDSTEGYNQQSLMLLSSDFNFTLINLETKELYFITHLNNSYKQYSTIDFHSEYIFDEEEVKFSYIYKILKHLDLDI